MLKFNRTPLIAASLLAMAFRSPTDGEGNQNPGAAPVDAAVKAPKVKLTNEQKLVKAKEYVAKLEFLIANPSATKAPKAAKVVPEFANGSTVSAFYGRGETKKQVTGTVIASGKLPNGSPVVSIMVGEGVAAQLLKVSAYEVTAQETATLVDGNAVETQIPVIDQTQEDDGSVDSAEFNADAILNG